MREFSLKFGEKSRQVKHYCDTFCRPTSTRVRVGGPDGGDGGRGGDVVFQADTRVKTLVAVRTHYRGRDGANGQGSYHQGNDGKGEIVKVAVTTHS